jgi:hypothetical protein
MSSRYSSTFLRSNALVPFRRPFTPLSISFVFINPTLHLSSTTISLNRWYSSIPVNPSHLTNKADDPTILEEILRTKRPRKESEKQQQTELCDCPQCHQLETRLIKDLTPLTSRERNAINQILVEMFNRFLFRPDLADDIRLLISPKITPSSSTRFGLDNEPKLHLAPRGFFSFLQAILNEFPIKLNNRKEYIAFQISNPPLYIRKIRELRERWCDAKEPHLPSLRQRDADSRKLLSTSKTAEHIMISTFLRESPHDVLKLFPFMVDFEYNLKDKPGSGDFKLASEEFPGFLVVVEAKILSKFFEERRSKVVQQMRYYSKTTRQENPDLVVLQATLTDTSGFQWQGGSLFVMSDLVELHNTRRERKELAALPREEFKEEQDKQLQTKGEEEKEVTEENTEGWLSSLNTTLRKFWSKKDK